MGQNAYTHPAEFDKTGARDKLRFPMFRQEVMSQTLWSAAEIIGRIKVTITEGYLRAPSVLPFMPLKSLVTFAFQHAPLRKSYPQVIDASQVSFFLWPFFGRSFSIPKLLVCFHMFSYTLYPFCSHSLPPTS